ncbi:efflux RND transporter permease subunit [Elusimicrobiota bacterium]
MISLFVKRPAMTIMFVLVFVVLGLVSFTSILVERTPRIDFPFVTISVSYRGAAPAEMESQIIKKIEDAVAEISQLKKIQSFAYEGLGLIFLEFESDVDANVKAIEVKDKVEPVQNMFPHAADKPTISKFDPMVAPIMDLILTSENPDEIELFEYADKKLKNQLSVIDGVASVEIYGGKERQINVKLDNMLMNKYFTTIADVVGFMGMANVNVSGGSIEDDYTKTNIRLLGEFESINDIKNMSIISREGRKLKLSDIAVVEDSFKEVDTYTRYNKENVVGLSVKKLSDGDAVNIIKDIRKYLPKIEKTLPEGMKLIVAYDISENIIRETNSTVINIIIGIILTILILYFFLENAKITLIAGIVIPSSIISAFFLMEKSNFTVNFITLLAIATALGTLIANALVIIESIDQELEHGKNSVEAAIDGTKQAAVAVIAAAGTNIAVFTPLAFLSGITGQFMKQFGMTVVYLTIFSILASFTLTPMLCALLLKPINKDEVKQKKMTIWRKLYLFPQNMMHFLVAEYRIVFHQMFEHPKKIVLLCALLMVSLAYPMRYIGSEFFPASDQDKIVVTIETKQGTPLNRTLEKVEAIEDLLKDVPEISSFLSYVGKDGSETAQVTVNLLPLKQRKRFDLDIINSLIPEASKIPGADISFARGEGMGGAGGDITVNVEGADYDKMIEISKEMRTIMMKTGYIRSTKSSYKEPKNEIRFIPNKKKMIQFGVTNSQVGDVLKFAIRGNDANVYKEKGEEYTIQIEMDDKYKETIDNIGNISIMTQDGLVPISKLGRLTVQKGYSTIFRRDKSRVIQVDGFLSKSTTGQVRELLREKFKDIDFPKGYGYKYVGEAEFAEESQKQLGLAFILAVLFTYMLLVSILNSFSYPFVIMTSVLTAFFGVFMFMFFFEFSFNIGAMMAMILIVGLVVNNSILMLDYTMKKMAHGKCVKDALWLGASVKFRAILMTSLAIVFGALPQVFDPNAAKASIGAVVVGGMTASILFTFILTPIAFWYMSRFQDFVKNTLSKTAQIISHKQQ